MCCSWVFGETVDRLAHGCIEPYATGLGRLFFPAQEYRIMHANMHVSIAIMWFCEVKVPLAVI